MAKRFDTVGLGRSVARDRIGGPRRMIDDYLFFAIALHPGLWGGLVALLFAALTWRRFAVAAAPGRIVVFTYAIAALQSGAALLSLCLTAADRLSTAACLTGIFGFWGGGPVAAASTLVAIGALVFGARVSQRPDAGYLTLLIGVNLVTTSIFLRSAGSCTV